MAGKSAGVFKMAKKKCIWCDDGWDEHCEMCGRETDKGMKKYGGQFRGVIVRNKVKSKGRKK